MARRLLSNANRCPRERQVQTQDLWQRSVLLLAVIVVAALAPQGCGNRDTGTLYREAMDAAANAQWTQARSLTGKILAVEDENLEARILHGLSLYELQEVEEAVTMLGQAAQSAPNSFVAQYFYGWALFETSAYADALRPLKKAYEIRKDHPDLLILLATCCLEQNLQEGLRYLQALRRFKPYRDDAKVYNDMALLWLGKPDRERAKELLLRAHAKDPDNPVILQNLAVLHDQYLRDYPQAVRYYRLCLRASRRRRDNTREAKVSQRLREIVAEMRHAGS